MEKKKKGAKMTETYACCNNEKECKIGYKIDPKCKTVCCWCSDDMDDERTAQENAEIYDDLKQDPSEIVEVTPDGE